MRTASNDVMVQVVVHEDNNKKKGNDPSQMRSPRSSSTRSIGSQSPSDRMSRFGR